MMFDTVVMIVAMLSLLAVPVTLIGAAVALFRKFAVKPWLLASAASAVLFVTSMVVAIQFDVRSPDHSTATELHAAGAANPEPSPENTPRSQHKVNDPPPPVPVAKQAEFLSLMDNYYTEYQRAENDIKRSTVFRQARSFDSGNFKASAFVVQDWKGQVTTISTNKGGTALLLRVELAGENVRVTFQEEGIKPTSAVYSAAGNLGEGECVIFQGKVVSEEDSYSESGAMRAPEYDFEFHQLKGCS